MSSSALSSSSSIFLQWNGKSDFSTPDSSPCMTSVKHFKSSCGQGEFWAGDNLSALLKLQETHASRFRLIYLDPPFFTGRAFDKKDRQTGESTVAYEDKWTNKAEYLSELGKRLTLMRNLLTEDGSLVLHVDPRVSHYLKVLCDEIFGEEAFASEIIWRYRRWPSKQDNFQRVHDVLLRYRKNPDVKPFWNQLYEPLSASTQATWGTKKQNAVYTEKGKRARSSVLEEESKGVPMGDVWDISVIAPVSKERTGYPSQKPEVLLERLISSLTRPGDLILDPYSGSGTTLATAYKLERKFVGMDESPIAIKTIWERLTKTVSTSSHHQDHQGISSWISASEEPESQTRLSSQTAQKKKDLCALESFIKNEASPSMQNTLTKEASTFNRPGLKKVRTFSKKKTTLLQPDAPSHKQA